MLPMSEIISKVVRLKLFPATSPRADTMGQLCPIGLWRHVFPQSTSYGSHSIAYTDPDHTQMHGKTYFERNVPRGSNRGVTWGLSQLCYVLSNLVSFFIGYRIVNEMS